MKIVRLLAALAIVTTLGACAGKSQHVFPPDASVQELAVADHGEWLITLRLHNYSFEAMLHFDRIEAKLQVDGKPAGTISSVIGINVPGLSADVIKVSLSPSAAAAHSLASGEPHAVPYILEGKLDVTPENAGSGSYPFKHEGWLSPVPGLHNVYR